jgi:hypothetical protein
LKLPFSRRTSGLIAPVCADPIYCHGYAVNRRSGYVRDWATQAEVMLPTQVAETRGWVDYVVEINDHIIQHDNGFITIPAVLKRTLSFDHH